MSKLTSETKKALIDLGNEARRRAYVPYSNYRVGAALQGFHPLMEGKGDCHFVAKNQKNEER